jgi:hypothetical protein
LSETKRYCVHCKTEHVVSPTYDNKRNLVGYFCNREKLLVSAETPLWDGENISRHILEFVKERVDMDVLERMERGRIKYLAKRVAFQLLQTDWAKERRLNFAFAQYQIYLDLVTIWTDLQPEGGR